MDTFLRDVRYGLRSWRRAPGAIAAALAALAAGIGAATAVFSVVSGVLLRPLPYQSPERLVMVWQDLRARGGPGRDWISPGLFVEWRARGTMFDALAAVRGWSPNLTGNGDEPELLKGAAVSPAYFAALGVPAAHGRVLADADDQPNGAPVAVISDGLWKRRFHGDPAVVGGTIQLDGQATTVVGVMPPRFRPAIVDADIWSPIRIDPAAAPRGIVILRVLGRLKAGVSVSQAQAGMAAVAAALEREDSEWERARVAVFPLHDEIVGGVRQMMLVLAGAVALVLAVACANVTSLLLARAADRAREITLRTALGAGRGTIVRQLVTESLLLAAVAGAAGAMLAWWIVRGLVAIAPASAPRLQDVHVDPAALAFCASVTVLAAAVSGLTPALAALRTPLNGRLRDGGREATGTTRLRSALVAGEIAAALVLVVGAALLLRTLVALNHVDLGFDADRLLTATVVPPRTQYRDAETRRELFDRLIARARAIPGVTAAAATNMLPMSGGEMNLSFEIYGRPPAGGPGSAPVAAARIVSPSYLTAMGMHLSSGRDLHALDTERAPGAVVVNETMASRYWPGRSPLGATLQIGNLEATIVGVVRDVHHKGPASSPGAEMYIPMRQFSTRQAVLVLRTAGDPARTASALRAAMKEIDPSLPLANVVTMDTLLAQNVSLPRFLATLLTGFAALAALLALVGVYGLLSFSVSRRVRELGVRMALGAGRARVLRLVLAQSAVLVAAGLVAGVALSALLSRLLQTLLFGVRAGDPLTLVSMAAAIAIAAMAASLPPALRAARVDPVVALRED